jgi:hypothetical protein
MLLRRIHPCEKSSSARKKAAAPRGGKISAKLIFYMMRVTHITFWRCRKRAEEHYMCRIYICIPVWWRISKILMNYAGGRGWMVGWLVGRVREKSSYMATVHHSQSHPQHSLLFLLLCHFKIRRAISQRARHFGEKD